MNFSLDFFIPSILPLNRCDVSVIPNPSIIRPREFSLEIVKYSPQFSPFLFQLIQAGRHLGLHDGLGLRRILSLGHPLVDALLEFLIVHIEWPHGLFFFPPRESAEHTLEGVIIKLELVLDSFLFCEQLVKRFVGKLSSQCG